MMTNQNDQETIKIAGHLGPLNATDKPLTLTITPLTVFIGPQGTGKSLVSQLLYFFRDAQYLISTYSKQEGPEKSVRKVIEGIRSGEKSERAFSSFVMGKSVDISYRGSNTNQVKHDWEITCYESNRTIRPKSSFNKEIKLWLEKIVDNPSSSGNIQPSTLFIPAERSFFSRLINSDPQSLGSSELPLTMREFTKFLFKSANIHQTWQELAQSQSQNKPFEVDEISEIITHELRGYAVFSREGPYARRWQWMPEDSKRPIEIEMASSGQMETWPMVSIAQAMFGWKESERPLFIHIEEPETHLHPSAQVAITKLIAYLCNKGFRLVITTHSVFVLYVLNNLVLSSQSLPNNKTFASLPEPKFRLEREQLSAYLFAEGTARPILDSKSGEIDESLLTYTLGGLEEQYNQIQSYGVLWE